MSGNRLDGDRSFLDDILLDELGDELGEDEVAALLGQGGLSSLQSKPNQSYGGEFSASDGMTTKTAMPLVEDENWKIIGDNVVFDRSASDAEGSETKRLIKPEEVPGAKTKGEYVPLSKRNIAASRRGSPGMWIVPERADSDMHSLAGMVFVEEEE